MSTCRRPRRSRRVCLEGEQLPAARRCQEKQLAHPISLAIGHLAAIQNSVTVPIGEAPGRTPATDLTALRDTEVRTGFPDEGMLRSGRPSLFAGYVIQCQSSDGRAPAAGCGVGEHLLSRCM